LSASFLQATFLFQLMGIPVGWVELSHDAQSYEYRSTHVIARDGRLSTRRRARRFDIAGEVDNATGRTLPALALWKKPEGPTGCRPAVDELSGQRGELCIDSLVGPVSGRLFAQPFFAEYGSDGRLSSLSVGTAKFVRVDAVPSLAPKDLFGMGVPIAAGQGALLWSPPPEVTSVPAMNPWSESEALLLSNRVRRELEGRSDAVCLDFARRFVALANQKGVRAVLVHGLHVQPGETRARPHAWVRIAVPGQRTLDIDVALGDPVRPQTHLPLAIGEGERSGALWLEVFEGRRQAVRASSH